MDMWEFRGVVQELDLVFRSAMQSGVVAAEEGEMIASVRNLDSKKIKAGNATMSESNRTLVWLLRECMWLAEFHPFRSGDHDTSSGHDLHRVRGANREASSSHQGHTVSWIYSNPMGTLWESRIHTFPHLPS